MPFNFKHLVQLVGRIVRKCEFQSNFQNGKLLTAFGCDRCLNNQKQNFHTGTPRMKLPPEYFYRRAAIIDARTENRVPQTFQENIHKKRIEGYFPTVDLPNTVFDNVPFKDLPQILVIATRNNTKLTLIDNGASVTSRSAGAEGFKNSRKGTNVAGQAAGSALGLRALKRGYKNIRVVVCGLGAGRQSAIKGLQLSGMNIISITDNTVFQTSLRPRKQRRL